MTHEVAIIGAGVSGLTCGVLFAESGYRSSIFAEHIGPGTTSAVAAALWYPYDTGPADKAIEWSLGTYRTLLELAGDPGSGVSLIELRTFSRAGEIEIPGWALPLGARRISSGIPSTFVSGFTLNVPLMDTSIYLDYLARRFQKAGGAIHANRRFETLEEIPLDLVINCSGMGARTLAFDPELEAHRGQVAIVPKNDTSYAIVCDDPPLFYAIPRTNDCLLGGTNEVSDDRTIAPAATARIVAQCSRLLGIKPPTVLDERVGLRPFRRSGVRLERVQSRDRRTVIHNYGHGGAGFTLSWGCAQTVLHLAQIRST